MSKQHKVSENRRLPVQIDPIRLAKAGQVLHGPLGISNFSRLKPDLASAKGNVEVHLNFDVNDAGVSYVKGTVTGELQLCCQRCLKALNWPLKVDIMLAFVENEVQMERLAGEFEAYLLPETAVKLSDIIEDEILLVLPQVLMHEAVTCRAASTLLQENTGNTREGQESLTRQKNPFEVLAGLKTNSKD